MTENIRTYSLATLLQHELSKYLSASHSVSEEFTRQRAYPTSQIQDSRRLFPNMNRRGSALQKMDKFIVERLAAQILVVHRKLEHPLGDGYTHFQQLFAVR